MPYTPEEIGRQVVVAAQSVQAADPGALGASMQVLLEDDNWRSYIDPADRRPAKWDDFRQFVSKRLQTSIDQLVVALHHTPRLAAAVLELASAPDGRPKKTVSNTDSLRTLRGSYAQGMRRLLRDRPDLADRVEAKELSVHAATIEAGFRKPTAAVPINTADAAIKALLRRFSREELLTALNADD